MDKQIKEFLGEGPYPFPIGNMQKYVNLYKSSNIIILEAQNTFSFREEQGTHAHSSYEFFIPVTKLFMAKVDKKRVGVTQNTLLPLNCDQFHGVAGTEENIYCLGIQVDKKSLQELARELYGRSEIFFVNQGQYVNHQLRQLIFSFQEECKNQQTGYRFALQSLSIQIMVNLLRNLKTNLPSMNSGRNYSEKKCINRSIEFLRETYKNNYCLEDVAGVANFSPYHFIRIFKTETGKTPYEYLLDIKIEKAQQMLKSKQKNISEVCYACGFNNPSHFATVFKRKVGVSPSMYRKQ